MKYEDWLYLKLLETANLCFTDFSANYKLIVYNEEEYIKNKDLNEGYIHIIIKRLSSSIAYKTKIQPVQLYVMSEANGLEVAHIILSKFASNYNWFSENVTEGLITTNYKHQYSDPAVLNNFSIVGTGYRSILFVSATLYETENIVDVYITKNNVDIYGQIEIDDIAYIVSAFNMGYTMTPDTQNFGGAFCVSIKDNANLTITVTMPSTSSTLMTKVLNIMKGQTDGNSIFYLDFKLGGISYEYEMKLINATFITAPNNIPSVQLGFML